MRAAREYRQCNLCDGGEFTLCTGCERTADAMDHARAGVEARIDAAIAAHTGGDTREQTLELLRRLPGKTWAEHVLLRMLESKGRT